MGSGQLWRIMVIKAFPSLEVKAKKYFRLLKKKLQMLINLYILLLKACIINHCAVGFLGSRLQDGV